MIDPQLQGIKWIKQKYGDELRVIRLSRKEAPDVIDFTDRKYWRKCRCRAVRVNDMLCSKMLWTKQQLNNDEEAKRVSAVAI